MDQTHIGLSDVFEKCTKSFMKDLTKVLKRALSMSLHPTKKDALSELSRSEVICLMAITSLGMLDVSTSNALSRAVVSWNLFPRVSSYFGGKLKEEYRIPRPFLIRAYGWARFGNTAGFLRVPSALVRYIKVLIQEAEEVNGNVVGPSAREHPSSIDHIVPDSSAEESVTPAPTETEDNTVERPSESARSSPTVDEDCIPPPWESPSAPQDDVGKPEVTENRERATQELWVAVWNGNGRAVEAAIKAGADLRAKNEVGDTALHVASSKGCEDGVRSLLLHGAEVEETGCKGYTPLHCAARSGSVDCVSVLLDAGADLNPATNIALQTPLHWAAECGHLPCVQLLVEKGSDLNAKDRNGRTPLALAWEHRSTLQYLRNVCGIR